MVVTPNAPTTESLHARTVLLTDTQWADTPPLHFLPEDPRKDVVIPVQLGLECQTVGWGCTTTWKGSGIYAIGEAGARRDRSRATLSVSVDIRDPHLESRDSDERTSRAPLSGDLFSGDSLLDDSLSSNSFSGGPPSAEAASHLERALPPFPTTFGSFGLSAQAESTLIVPSFPLTDIPEGYWAIFISSSSPTPDPLEVLASTTPTSSRPPRGLHTDVEYMTQKEWRAPIRALTARLRAGDALKAVMARDTLMRADSVTIVHYPLKRLGSLYSQTWRSCVDSLIDVSPGMLGPAVDGVLHSRVPAGTSPTEWDTELLQLEKNLRERALATEPVASVLHPIVDSLQVPETPFILNLPNVAHLTSDVQACLGELPLLRAVVTLHPMTAMRGTPRDLTLELPEEYGRTERGRYSSLVSQANTNGEGEFCIALHCRALEKGGRVLKIFAGGGIMSNSDPGEKLTEIRRKMVLLLNTLGVNITAQKHRPKARIARVSRVQQAPSTRVFENDSGYRSGILTVELGVTNMSV